MKRLGGKINTRRNPPCLQGVTGATLQILGVLWDEISVGDHQSHKQRFPVVPDAYLSGDVLLGCDVLGQAPLTWDGKKRLLRWGNTPYVVNCVPRQRNKVERVKTEPVVLTELTHTPAYSHINLRQIKLGPYQTEFVSVPIKEKTQTLLVVHPQSRTSHNAHPCLVGANNEGLVHLPLVNATKSGRVFRTSTIIGSYETLTPNSDNPCSN